MKTFLIFLLAALSIGADAATTLPVQLINPTGSTAGQAIVSTGSSSAPGWAGVNAVTLNGATFASPPALGYGSTTPEPVAATTISATGAITPTYPAGIVGNKTGSNVTAGSSGEYICAQVTNGGSPTGCATNTNTPVSLSTGVNANVTSISLTAGDWDISGNVVTNPAGTTVQTYIAAGISTTSASFGTIPAGGGFSQSPYTAQTGTALAIPVATVRLNLSGTTTVYLVTNVAFTASTDAAYGFIGARRH